MTAFEEPATIVSDRLDLVWMSPAFMHASLERRSAEAEARIGALLPPDWPLEPVRQVMERRLAQLASDPAEAPWLLRGIVRRLDRVMVGYINFHGAPNEQGQAELGYTVFESQRRRGYAMEAILAMIGWASERHGVRRFLLSIAPANEASLAVAAKLGFLRIGSQIDEIDGEEYVFELCRVKNV